MLVWRRGSIDEVAAAFGGVKVRHGEYLEDAVTGTALLQGDYVCDTRAQDRGYDILRWDGFVLGIDWDWRGDSPLTLSRPGRSLLAEDMAGVPFVGLTDAESRETLRAACRATLVRMWEPTFPGRRVTDPDTPGGTLTVADYEDLVLPAPVDAVPARARRRWWSGHRARALPTPSVERPATIPTTVAPVTIPTTAGPVTHDAACALTLVDTSRAESFDYRATASTRTDAWAVERTSTPWGRAVTCRAPRVPGAGVLTSRLVTRTRRVLPPPSPGPRLVRWSARSARLSWPAAGLGVDLAPVPDAAEPTYESSRLGEADLSPVQLTAVRAACEALVVYGALHP